MAERAEQAAAARVEHERERAMVDDVMRAIDEEDRLQGAPIPGHAHPCFGKETCRALPIASLSSTV